MDRLRDRDRPSPGNELPDSPICLKARRIRVPLPTARIRSLLFLLARLRRRKCFIIPSSEQCTSTRSRYLPQARSGLAQRHLSAGLESRHSEPHPANNSQSTLPVTALEAALSLDSPVISPSISQGSPESQDRANANLIDLLLVLHRLVVPRNGYAVNATGMERPTRMTGCRSASRSSLLFSMIDAQAYLVATLYRRTNLATNDFQQRPSTHLTASPTCLYVLALV